MNHSQETLPVEIEDAAWMEYVRQKAHAAIVIELREFDWSLLSPALARQIHAMIPHD